MAVPGQAEVRAVLADFEARLRHVMDRAWLEWEHFPDKAKFVFLARTRAVILFDFIARHAIAEFDGDPNVRVNVKRQTVQFLFRDRVFLRFKKGNGKGVGSNIETQAVLNFIDPQRTIPGLVPDILKVEVVYKPNDLGTSLDDVSVVARDLKKRIWAYPLERVAPQVVVVPVLPLDPTPPRVVPRERTDDVSNNKE